jgi:hypothetical protein
MKIINYIKSFFNKKRFDAKIHKPDKIVYGKTTNGNKGLVMYLESENKWIHAWQDASARPYLYIDVVYWAEDLRHL